MLTFFRNRKGQEDEFAIQGTALGVGLQNLDEEVGNVSFGIEKLTEIGRALISKPPVLLMDEPFAGLGKTDIDRVIDAIEKWRPHALGVIIVDHNIDLLSKICDRLLVLDSGAVIACGPPYEVLSEPHVQKAYFGGE
jgi:branched-chain amino acid transport system ATP-binding protein